MAILQECPICKRKQTHENRKCQCGYDLTKGKKQGKIRYFHSFRVRDGFREKDGKKVPKYIQRKEYAGDNLKEALAIEGKRKAQIIEGNVLDVLPKSKKTFNELTEWYLGRDSIKVLSYYKTLTFNLNSFNEKFGQLRINDLTLEDLRDYQTMQKQKGLSDCYVDQHVRAARTMVSRAIENDMVAPDALKPFNLVKRLMKNSRANARDRILSPEEYTAMMEHLPRHLKPIFAMGYHTGMRKNEILELIWDKVDLKKRLITLQPEDTKDKEKRLIPINDELSGFLHDIPRAIHDDHVFLYRGKPIKDIRNGLKTACKKSGVPYGRKDPNGFTFHDLRHTFNTNMRKAGVSESVIMAITGHSTNEMFPDTTPLTRMIFTKRLTPWQHFFRKVLPRCCQIPETKKGLES